MNKFLSKRWVEYSLLAFIIVSGFSSIYAPKILFFPEAIKYAIHFMFLFLGLGMVFLTMGRKKLMFASLACSAAICLFLKAASNEDFLYPQTSSENHIDIAHINLSNVTDIDAFFDLLEELDPDIVSIQELTPDWFMVLTEKMKKKYPYNNVEVRIDPYGMGQYSKLPFVNNDKLLFEKIPNLISAVRIGERMVYLIDSYVTQFNPNPEYKSEDHLTDLTEYIKDLEAPVISIGDFNMVYWERNITNYRTRAQLKNSRIDYGSLGLSMPSDHIFYSEELECTAFEELVNSAGIHLGIVGKYQFKNEIAQGNSPIEIGANF